MHEKVFKKSPNEICGRQPLKNWSDKACLNKIFKGCLPQVLLGKFSNAAVFCIYKFTKNGNTKKKINVQNIKAQDTEVQISYAKYV